MARGQAEGWTSAVAIAEVIWVLTGGSYRFTREQIRDALTPVLQVPNLRVDDRTGLLRGLAMYARTRIDFIDAFHAAIVQDLDPPELYSFDRDFDRIPGITRIEP
jgi:predicted nucleic-acid-binding protein